MKTVAFFYWEHEDGVTQKFYEMLSSSFQRHGYNVIPMCTTAKDFEDQCTRLSKASSIEFCFALTPQAINISVNELPIWKFINTPFFIYVIDTPIYHLTSKSMLDLIFEKTQRIVFGYPDANQMKIMNNACKSMGTTHNSLFIPFAAPPNPNKINSWNDRDIEISIFGNIGKEISAHNIHSSIEETLEKYKNTEIPVNKWSERIYEFINSEYSMNVTQELLSASNDDYKNIFDPIWSSAICDADSFIKRVRRIQIAKSINGRKIHTFGIGWDVYGGNNMINHGKTSYANQFEIFNNSKISINIDPNWNFGVHDRVFNAASVGCVALTQRNPYIESVLPDRHAVICYASNGNDINDTIDRNLGYLEDIAKEGAIRTSKYHTWDNRVSEIISYMSHI